MATLAAQIQSESDEDEGKTADVGKSKAADAVERIERLPETAPVLQAKLSDSVETGELSEARALSAAKHLDKEIRKVIELVQAFGARALDGKLEIPFGVLSRKAMSSFWGNVSILAAFSLAAPSHPLCPPATDAAGSTEDCTGARCG